MEPIRRTRRPAPEFEGRPLEQVQVRIGDACVGREATMLFTIGLGSCVAIALYDAAARVGGLAHAMLPSPANGRRSQAASVGRFVTTAVPHLVELMVSEGASAVDLRARLAGGASMFRDMLDTEGLRLGERNVEAARESLAAAHIPVDGEDVLGTYGRSVFLRAIDGHLLVTSVAHGDVIL